MAKLTEPTPRPAHRPRGPEKVRLQIYVLPVTDRRIRQGAFNQSISLGEYLDSVVNAKRDPQEHLEPDGGPQPKN